jgi:16S rRNA C967 or C1407 C5-methylase (RsmB/RsmF family)
VDEYTDEVSPEDTETAQPDPELEDHPRYKQMRAENQNLRQKLRRTELEANFGKDVVELIPEELPLSKWEEYAGRLAERLQKPAPPEQNEQAAEETSQEDEPAGLAAVTNASAPGASLPEDLKTVAEIKELAKTDPLKANELITAGKFVKQTEW